MLLVMIPLQIFGIGDLIIVFSYLVFEINGYRRRKSAWYAAMIMSILQIFGYLDALSKNVFVAGIMLVVSIAELIYYLRRKKLFTVEKKRQAYGKRFLSKKRKGMR